MKINFSEFNRKMRQIVVSGKKVVVGIDGECFSGKTTLARYICERFPDFIRISLDEYLEPAQVRIDACKNKIQRKMMFEHWYDKEQLHNLVVPKNSNVVIEGMFLMTALPRDNFDMVFVVVRDNLKQGRINRLLKRNNILSMEEAMALDDANEETWSNYVNLYKISDDNQTIYIKMG